MSDITGIQENVKSSSIICEQALLPVRADALSRFEDQ